MYPYPIPTITVTPELPYPFPGFPTPEGVTGIVLGNLTAHSDLNVIAIGMLISLVLFGLWLILRK